MEVAQDQHNSSRDSRSGSKEVTLAGGMRLHEELGSQIYTAVVEVQGEA